MDIKTQNKLNNYEIVNNSMKNVIINTIYSSLDMSLFKYKIFDNKEDINMIDTNNFYVTPHIIGINCWLIYFNNNETINILIINKKNLKVMKNQSIIQNTNIHNVGSQSSNLFSPLSIFDGKFFIDENDMLIFNIFDMYIYQGKIYTDKHIDEKIKIIYEILPELNKGLNNIIVKLVSLFKINDIYDLVYNKIKNSKLKINGLIFIPKKTGCHYIYINDNDFLELKRNDTIENINMKFNKSIPIHMNIMTQCDTELIDNLILKKTAKSDVFEVYKPNVMWLQEKHDIYKNIIEENKLGIAHIPDIKTSHYCKNMSNDNYVFVNKCIFNKKFNKWIPII